MTTAGVSLALRALRQDWRMGELRILAAALVVAVTAVTSVGLFADRVQQAMTHSAAGLLAADLAVETSQPIRDVLLQRARQAGLATASTVEIPTVLAHDGSTQLIQAKAVTAGYPLRGALRIATAAGQPGSSVRRPPGIGMVWIDSRLRTQLNLHVGDSLKLGERRLTIAGILLYEPDRGSRLFTLAPRVMLNRRDLASTGLIHPASRVQYRLLLAGPAQALAGYRSWFQDEQRHNEKLLSVKDARPAVRAALEQANQYMLLAALVAVLIAGGAIALAARHYIDRQADTSALLRCLGASRRLVFRIYMIRLMIVGLLASLVGCLLGLGGQQLLALTLAGWFAGAIPAPGGLPLAAGLVTGMLVLLGFTLPSLLGLRAVPPLRVLRREMAPTPPSAWLTTGSALLVLGLLVVWQAQDTALMAKWLGGAILLAACFWGCGYAVFHGVSRMRLPPGLARLGLLRLARRPGTAAMQVMAFGLGLTALLVLVITRGALLANWQASLPRQAPNHFLINVQPEDLGDMRALFAEYGHPAPRFYPIARGRLMRINGQTVTRADYDNARAKRLVSREFNLTWTRVLPADNRVVAGQWQGHDKGFSVASGIADTLGMTLGDELVFRIGGRTVAAKIDSIRTVDWDSFNANFFVIAAPALLAGYPASYISSFYLDDGQGDDLVAAMVRAFPGVAVLDVEALIEQIRAIMDRASLAIESLLVLVLLAGVMVMLAVVQVGRSERGQEIALLRALGGRRGTINGALLMEFGTLGLLAGLFSAVGASLAGYWLTTQVFGLDYQPSGWLWGWAVAGGITGVGLSGWLATRHVLEQSPLRVLHHAG